MSDPAFLAAQRAIAHHYAVSVEPTPSEVCAAREALKPIRAKHRPVTYINRQRCCVTCFDSAGKPHLWPCPTAPLIYPSEELQ
ncbi:hypothetical protein [Mycobacterium phage WXIN]|nr:hypothetical protein [Mycobacterium phage WXIN]